MNNVYETPKSDVSSVNHAFKNNSGMKEDVYPDGVKGWSWGAFFLNWIWAGFNKSYIGFLALIPYIGFIFAIYLGIKGRQLAWKNKRWDSLDHFNRVKKKWSVWGVCIVLVSFFIGIISAIVLPAYQDYLLRSGGA